MKQVHEAFWSKRELLIDAIAFAWSSCRSKQLYTEAIFVWSSNIMYTKTSHHQQRSNFKQLIDAVDDWSNYRLKQFLIGARNNLKQYSIVILIETTMSIDLLLRKQYEGTVSCRLTKLSIDRTIRKKQF